MSLSRLVNKRSVFAVLALAVMLSAALFTARTLYDIQHYISTENATLQGTLVRVASPNTGRVFTYLADVGSLVRRDDPVAVIDIPISASLPAGGGNRSTFLDARDRLAEVTSPVSGVVVSRSASAGDSVAPNQTLLTVVDTNNVWVVANIEETKVSRVRPGQYVEVYIDSLQRTVDGMVESVVPATTSTFSLLPPQNAAGNFTKVVQLVPVRITLSDHAGLIVGVSVRVRIHLS
ncbi:MAG: HlyD family efflux transporter periplasmic adaptor subunit [Dehalococcoidia bacterium]|nr:HlyD family efflux transporter periplasmic adaptor subunit [Dehalococcoidia bacterium]